MKVWTKIVSAVVLSAVMLTSGAATALAQQTEKAPPPPTVPLKVTVTVSRFQGEKKTASLPFVLWVNTGGVATIQMGSQVPVPSTVIQGGQVASSFTLKDIGTNITCQASNLLEGLYKLEVSVQDSQVFRQVDGKTDSLPSFQSFRSTNSPMLRDGQTVQFAVATDKTSGEVIKLEVTLNVVK